MPSPNGVGPMSHILSQRLDQYSGRRPNRYSIVLPLALLTVLLVVDALLRIYVPSAGTSSVQMGAWGLGHLRTFACRREGSHEISTCVDRYS